jgi:C_GCAxxG_C_C family probable redox protein
MKDEGVFKCGSGLHGGIGGMHDACGALLGASMMLGLMYGLAEEAAKSVRQDKPTQLVAQLYKWFENEFGSVQCRVITAGFDKEVADASTRELTEKERLDGRRARCNELAGKIAARTAEMFLAVDSQQR